MFLENMHMQLSEKASFDLETAVQSSPNGTDKRRLFIIAKSIKTKRDYLKYVVLKELW